jgi:5-methylcytosine-specific restriction enzyme subunit McrC
MKMQVLDCSPFDPQPTEEQGKWLHELVGQLQASQHVLPLAASNRDEDEPPVYCERDGTWWAGRYVGTISFENSSLTIAPRFGLAVLAEWLGQVMGVAIVDTPGRHREDTSFLVRLLAIVWARAFAEASRHGLPNLRNDIHCVGHMVRGRLDIQRTIGELAKGREQAAFVQRERSVSNPVGRVIGAAYCVLRRWMGAGHDLEWLPDRARSLLSGLLSEVGASPRVPTDAELAQVHYTPITHGFESVARLSKQIIRRKGLLADVSKSGKTQGILLDVAELWELFVVAALKRAAENRLIVHGTRNREGRSRLLVSDTDGTTMADLRPDAVVLHRSKALAIVDAKYKSLRPNWVSPQGVQREDLYQMASYLAGFSDASPKLGALVYPSDLECPTGLPAERRNPWRLGQGDTMLFLTLPHSLEAAATKLKATLFARAPMIH